jgi:hypothetical protein
MVGVEKYNGRVVFCDASIFNGGDTNGNGFVVV